MRAIRGGMPLRSVSIARTLTQHYTVWQVAPSYPIGGAIGDINLPWPYLIMAELVDRRTQRELDREAERKALARLGL